MYCQYYYYYHGSCGKRSSYIFIIILFYIALSYLSHYILILLCVLYFHTFTSLQLESHFFSVTSLISIISSLIFMYFIQIFLYLPSCLSLCCCNMNFPSGSMKRYLIFNLSPPLCYSDWLPVLLGQYHWENLSVFPSRNIKSIYHSVN